MFSLVRFKSLSWSGCSGFSVHSLSLSFVPFYISNMRSLECASWDLPPVCEQPVLFTVGVGERHRLSFTHVFLKEAAGK